MHFPNLKQNSYSDCNVCFYIDTFQNDDEKDSLIFAEMKYDIICMHLRRTLSKILKVNFFLLLLLHLHH